MKGISMNVFRGLTIMLLTIIAYMLIDSFINIPLLTIILCACSGTLVIFTCRGMNREELNMFRASLIMGIIFFFIGNYIIFTKIDQYYLDELAVYSLTMGFLLSAIGMIVMFSSIPIIIYKDLEEHLKKNRVPNNTDFDKT